ncbi:tam domain protein [Xylariomycetidae sp. FL0641]|nr:tam domain protein [Xylariomycetidae sp. FL0641]
MASSSSGAGGAGQAQRPGSASSEYVPQDPNRATRSSAAQPPFDFPFTFEYVHDASRSIRLEPDPAPSVNTGGWDADSITSSISRYREENGRTYHAYNDGSYVYPNDELELERLDWQFFCIKRLFNDKNYFAPWSRERPPKRILDLATGTGMWAIEVAEEFESAHVVGTDLAPTQPDRVPPNVHFYVHDAIRDEWWWPDPFDYIHLRMTLGAWGDFEADVARKAFDHLEPDGWFEAQELLPRICCDDDTMPDDFAPKTLFDDLHTCANMIHRPIDVAATYKQGLINAGFVDVTQTVYKLPINGWPKQKNWKTFGDLWKANMQDGIQGIAMALLHRVRGLKREVIEVHLMAARRGFSDKRVHAYQKFHVIMGRKPRPDEMVTTTSTSSS